MVLRHLHVFYNGTDLMWELTLVMFWGALGASQLAH